MNDKTYNGWTNYATWRVNLEVFDGCNPEDTWGGFANTYELSKALKEYAEDLIYQGGNGNSSLAVDYALAFLSDVDWYKIAEHMMADMAEDQEAENA